MLMTKSPYAWVRMAMLASCAIDGVSLTKRPKFLQEAMLLASLDQTNLDDGGVVGGKVSAGTAEKMFRAAEKVGKNRIVELFRQLGKRKTFLKACHQEPQERG